MRNRILLFIFGALLTTNFSFAQRCGTYEGSFEEQKQKYPAFYQGLEDLNSELEAEHQTALSKMKNLKVEDGKKIIPVVVHVIHDFGNENISDASIQEALDILNANFNGQSDNFLAKTPDVFAHAAGNLNIEFRLAKIDPAGNPTTGIIRIQSTLTSEPQPRDAVKSLSYWNSYEYFNIWTLKKFAPQADGNTLLGFAQFPFGGAMSTDGVALLASQMESGGTLTHEAGHWLGLRHVWGDAVCGDDGVADTPPAREPNFNINLSHFPYHVGALALGCIADSLNYAGEMFVNYMDYSDDVDVTMFTKGQNAVMNETLEGVDGGFGYRQYLWSAENVKAAGVANGYVAPTCTGEPKFYEYYSNHSACLGNTQRLIGNQNIFDNVTSLSWDLGDGNTSTVNTPTFIYDAVGSYDVSLTLNYEETNTASSTNLSDLDIATATSYDSVINSLIVQGTEAELLDMGATGVTEILLDSMGVYYGLADSSYFRGFVEEKVYTAYYVNSCTVTELKEDFIVIHPTTSTNTEGSYNYNFDDASDLGKDWVSSMPLPNDEWNFNAVESISWDWRLGTSVNGNGAALMIDREDLTFGSAELISKAYNLSALSSPAIKFSWAGAGVNTFPSNELNVTYSIDCGESWKTLGSLTTSEVVNAGFYINNFLPTANEWSDTIMTKSQLKNSNVRFKFEYVANDVANNFFLDNIQIGEADALFQTQTNNNTSRLSIYPNPASESSAINIRLENLANKNVEVKLINILGEEVMHLFDGEVQSNYEAIPEHDFSHLKGIYFVRVSANGDVIITDKIVLTK